MSEYSYVVSKPETMELTDVAIAAGATLTFDTETNVATLTYDPNALNETQILAFDLSKIKWRAGGNYSLTITTPTQDKAYAACLPMFTACVTRESDWVDLDTLEGLELSADGDGTETGSYEIVIELNGISSSTSYSPGTTYTLMMYSKYPDTAINDPDTGEEIITLDKAYYSNYDTVTIQLKIVMTCDDYPSGVFFEAAGEGGTGSDECTATSSQVLAGYTAVTSDSDDEAVEGTMTNNGSVTGTVNCGASYTIPKGYHDGTGKVTGNSLSSQTSGTAAATDILSGKTAWVGGTQLKGSMTNNGAKTASLNCGGSYTIPAGYHNGSGKVTANTLASQTAGTATAANILSGKTAWVGGTKLTGSMTSVASIDTAKSVSGYNPMYVRMTNGAHVTNATSGYPEVSVTQAQIISAIGITAAKIVKGNTILGLAGTGITSYKTQNYSGISSGWLSFTKKGGTTKSFQYLSIAVSFTPMSLYDRSYYKSGSYYGRSLVPPDKSYYYNGVRANSSDRCYTILISGNCVFAKGTCVIPCHDYSSTTDNYHYGMIAGYA